MNSAPNPAFIGDYRGYVFDVRSIAVADTSGKNETSPIPLLMPMINRLQLKEPVWVRAIYIHHQKKVENSVDLGL
jgi:hypothetical protein